MDNPSLSPPSPASSGEEGEILTPAQRVPAATTPPPAAPPPAPTASDSHPPSGEGELDIELAKARFGDYLRRMEKKDNKGKAKNSSTRAAPPLVPQSSESAPAAPAAATPSTSTQYMQGNYYGAVPQHPYSTGMFPSSNPQPWAAGGAYGGIQGPPRYPNPYTLHQNYQIPQQPIVPPWYVNQWTMLPDQRFGVPQPAMDKNWFYNQPQHG